MDEEKRSLTPYGWFRRHKLKFVAVVTILAGLIVLAFATRGPGLEGEWHDRHGRPLPDSSESGEGLVLDVYSGDAHCDWQNVIFMEIAWPPGSVITGGRNRPNLRQYIRNPGPGRAPQEGLPATYVEDAALPQDAFDTGFHRGGWRLWVSPSQADRYIYVVDGDRVERWTRSERRIGCR